MSEIQPTEAELAILRVLWTIRSGTVREVFDQLSHERNLGYTAVLKTMQIMTEKGLVLRDDRERAHIYRANVSIEETERGLIDRFVDRFMEGSADRLLLRALESKKASKEEIAEIKKLIESWEKNP
jgi:predicted transcriptional regulator